ncbi:MAG: GTP cyclohydrolase [Luteibaculaceae bacterium]
MKKVTQTFNWIKRGLLYPSIALLAVSVVFSSCDRDEVEPPQEENEVEEFTYIEFIFTNVDDPNDVRKGIWEDEDGFGPLEPAIVQQPTLAANTTYKLTFVMENRLVTPVEDVLDEILDEADEHQIFFEFSTNLFTSPTGTGNIQDRNSPINYLDFDENGLPLGLQTNWTTANPQTGATFRAVLAHKPDVKSPTSTWNSGDIDWDITFNVTVE